MLWATFAVAGLILGAGLVAIGVSLPMYEYAVLGGILAVAGLFGLVSLRRGPKTSHLWD
jgi:hydrogenase/urease accessory protein HupE